MVVVEVTGRGATEAFRREPGGHRWQRIPPTERRGRVHSSSVTVAVMRQPVAADNVFDPADVEWTATRGSGAGGQHRNKTASAVIAKHRPTGLTVRVESERSQRQNRATAFALLGARLLAAKEASEATARDRDRKEQVGTGQRGDKVRTVALQRDQATDHRTGKRVAARVYLAGNVEALW